MKEMKSIVFFDGTCGFCSRSVALLHRLDRHRRLYFAPSGGETARKLAHSLAIPLGKEESIHFLEFSEESSSPSEPPLLHVRSGALFHICYRIGYPLRLLSYLMYLPKAPFDYLYTLFARHRHTIFSPSSCSLEETLRERLLP